MTLLTAIAMMFGAVGFAQAQTRSEETLLLDATQKALAEARAKAAAAEAESARLKKQLQNIGASLVEANRHADQYRENYNKLLLETEALGLATFTEGEKGMTKRMLAAISDRRILEKERETMAHALLDLSDSIKSFMATAESSDVTARADLQAALKQAEVAIGITRQKPVAEAPKSLDEGKIISIRRDFGIVVFNVGKKDGAKIGMPIELFRKDRKIGTAMIADVRDNRSGALITKLIDDSDDAKIGDRMRVQTQKNL